MIGNLHRRVGDQGSERSAWVRAIYSDLDLTQNTGLTWSGQGRTSGLQAGVDLWSAASWRVGAFVGALDGSMDVSGYASRAFGMLGTNDLRSSYLGAYATWIDTSGWYADAVLQAGWHRYSIRPASSPSASGDASSASASIELGRSFPIGASLSIEPQAQLLYQGMRFDDVQLAAARVRIDADGAWVGRLGVRVKGDFATTLGRLQPYARINLYHSTSGADTLRLSGPAVGLDASSAHGYTSTEVAGGLTLGLAPGVAVYGEVGRLFGGNGGDAQVKSSVQGSLGIRLGW